MSSTAKQAILLAAALYVALGRSSAQATGGADGPWVLGIARFAPAKAADSGLSLLATLPRLVCAELKSLPPRLAPQAEASELAAILELRARFSAGGDLAAKLDARAARFLDPSLDLDETMAKIAAADAEVAASAKKLAEATRPTEAVEKPKPERKTKIWDGNALGQLIDLPGPNLAQSARQAGVDLLVTGTIAEQSGYAIVQVRGFDAALNREVFSWRSFCSIDDPAPLAADLARRLELWAAGRDFGRADISVKPASARISVDGQPIEGGSRVLYAYGSRSFEIEARASGYAPRAVAVEVGPGDRKVVAIELEPLATGRASIVTDPPEASISVDSTPVGRAPLDLGLNGTRGIASVSAEGMESQSLVLPAAGEESLGVSLLPSDGLGPTGRITAAKDSYYRSLGWFVLSLPATALASGAFSGYDDAYARSGRDSLLISRNVSAAVLVSAAVATAATLSLMIVRLVKYLGTAR